MLDGIMIGDRAIDGLPHQVDFWNNDTQDAQIGLVAALGQGKSYGLFVKCMKLASLNEGLDGMLVVPTLTMAKRIHIEEWPALAASFGVKLTYHKQDAYFQWPWGKTWVGSAEHPERLAGANLAYCLFDELGLQSERAYERGSERVRHPRATLRQVGVGGTPEGLNFYADLFDEPDASTGVFTIRGKTWHPDLAHYPGKLKRLYGHDKALMDAYARGLFVPMRTGRVYHPFNRHIHVNDADAQYEPGLPLILGCDFNVDGMTWEVLQIGPDWINFIDEIGLESNGTTTEACEAFFERWGPDQHPGQVIICGDSAGNARSTAGTTDYKDIRNAFREIDYSDFRIAVDGSNPKQKDRANTMNYHLARVAEGSKRVRVHSRCERLIKDFERVVWKHGATGTSTIDKKDAELTHPSDAATYPVYKLASIKAGGLETKAQGVPRSAAPEQLTGMRF